MRFRAITPEDAPSLLAVRTSVRENPFSLEALAAAGITASSVAQRLRGSCRGWLCETQEGVVGFCMGDQNTGELWVLAVLPGFEGRGIGSKLLGLTEDWFWSQGCQCLWLWTSVDRALRAYQLYRKRGWREDEIKNGQLFMSKPMPDPRRERADSAGGISSGGSV